MSQISKLRTTLSLVILTALLSGCAERQTPPTAAVGAAGQGSAVGRRAAVQAQLRAMCGTPTNWTAAQKRTVAAFIDKHASELGLQLLAGEWDRLDAAVKICRGGAVPTT